MTPPRLWGTLVKVELATDRLLLRPLESADTDALVTCLNDWEVARWLARPPYPYAPADADAFIALVRAAHEQAHPLLFGIAEGRARALIGVIGIDRADAGGELGYWLRRPFWGRGYGPEAARTIIAAAAGAGLMEVCAFVDPDNARSIRLLENCGFEPNGTAVRDGRDGAMTARRFLLRTL